MGRLFTVTMILACACAGVIPAQEKQVKKSPSDVVKAVFKEPGTDAEPLLFNKPEIPDFAKQLARIRESQGKKMEILFEIQDGPTAVVGVGIRGEEFRRGIDIDPMFLIDKNGWKMLLVQTPDELDELLRTVPAKTAQQMKGLKTKFDQKSEETYAAVEKERAKPLAISKKNLQGLWHELADKKMSVVNLEANDRFVTGYIANGKFHDRLSGDWAITAGKLVLTGDGGAPVRRYTIEKASVEQLVLVSEGSKPAKSTLEKTPEDPLMKLFPDLRAAKKSP